METLTKVKVVIRYFTTPEQGIEIVQDALNAGWKQRDGQTLKEIKKDIKSIPPESKTTAFFMPLDEPYRRLTLVSR